MKRTILASLAALVLSGCANQVTTQVTRFHEGKLQPGQTFEVVPADADTEGPEFRSYVPMIRERMRAHGYRPANRNPRLKVIVSYGTSEGRTRIRAYPGYRYPVYSFYIGRGHRYYDGFAYPYYVGYVGPEIVSSVVYTRRLQLRILDRASGEVVFEGRAISEGRTRELSRIMPYLVESMFRGFPGKSGATNLVVIRTEDGRRY